jgi:hypothetical protein
LVYSLFWYSSAFGSLWRFGILLNYIKSTLFPIESIGKTSLLRRFLEPEIIAKALPDPKQYTLIESDFHLMMSLTPETFWRDLLQSVVALSPQVEPILHSLLTQEQFSAIQLNQVFRRLAQENHRVILLLDEFDAMLGLPAFSTPDFLGALRTIAHKSGGLVLITASRESIAEMNEHLDRNHTDLYGSSLLNYLQNISIGGLSPGEVTRWLGQHFEISEIQLIEQLSGRHPYLLQIAGELAFEAKMQGAVDFARLYSLFVDQAQDQFRDMWKCLNPKAQIALVIFTLDYLSGQIASGEKFSLKQAEKQLIWYMAEINDMAKRGTLEAGSKGQYKIGSLAFLFWIAENKIVGTRGDEPREAFEEWLAGKHYKLGKLITQEQITWLQETWRKIPDGLIDLARKAILPEYLQ